MTPCPPENIEAVKLSTRHRSQELNISRINLRPILEKYLGMTPYKVQ